MAFLHFPHIWKSPDEKKNQAMHINPSMSSVYKQKLTWVWICCHLLNSNMTASFWHPLARPFWPVKGHSFDFWPFLRSCQVDCGRWFLNNRRIIFKSGPIFQRIWAEPFFVGEFSRRHFEAVIFTRGPLISRIIASSSIWHSYRVWKLDWTHVKTVHSLQTFFGLNFFLQDLGTGRTHQLLSLFICDHGVPKS